MRGSTIFVYTTSWILAASMKISEIDALCADKCKCSGTYASKALTVDCHRRPDVDVDQLTEQLDSLLSSNLTYGRLTSLSIVNTPLTHVPRSVCRLTTLIYLHVNRNRLVRLPDNCLTNLTGLIEIQASSNNISELQDGLFDGLCHLTRLHLNKNEIASISLRVFNGSAMLTKLTFVNLDDNKLTSLEPWPYFVGVNGRSDEPAQVKLARNYVRHFPNTMGLELKCGMKIMRVLVRLDYNRVQHILDILHGWNVNMTTLLCITPKVGNTRQSTVYLRGNMLNCDCVDFEFFRYWVVLTQSSLLYDTQCGAPDNLSSRRVDSLQLIELVCEVTERCPQGCLCAHRPANATLHVYCSKSNLTVLPLELPALPKSYTKYKLDLSSNRLLRHLEHRAYFVNTSILDVSHSGIETVDNWKELLLIQYLYLHANRLASLPRSINTLSVSTECLSLNSNPWRCNCDDRWISKWLDGIKHILLNPANIECSSPGRLVNRNLMHMSEDEFCVDPTTKALLVGIFSVAGAVAVLLLVGVIVYRLRVRLYTRWKFHPFDRDECLGEDMDYDVFLSCSSSDNLPHGNAIRERLEDCGYHVCYPPRDFIPGETVYDNIYHAVVHSRRTVCFLTSNFIQSSCCMYEFDVALHHNVMVKRKKRLIVLMALDSPNDLYDNDASDTAALRQYLRQYTYLDYTADDWLHNLLYALPVRGLQQPRQAVPDGDQHLINIRPTEL